MSRYKFHTCLISHQEMEGKKGSRRSSNWDQFQLLSKLHQNHIATYRPRAKTDPSFSGWKWLSTKNQPKLQIYPLDGLQIVSEEIRHQSLTSSQRNKFLTDPRFKLFSNFEKEKAIDLFLYKYQKCSPQFCSALLVIREE